MYANAKHVLLVVLLDGNRDLLDFVDSKIGGSSKSSDNGLRVETLLHIRLQLLQEFGCQKGDRGGAIPNLSIAGKKRPLNHTKSLNFHIAKHTQTAHLSILGACNVYQGFGCRMNHVQQFQDRCSVIGDRALA